MRRVRCDQHELRELIEGWELAGTEPGECGDASSIGALDWMPVEVPGTVAAALRPRGSQAADELDGRDWWFRTRFEAAPCEADEELVLALDGIATVSEVYLNGQGVLASESMFAAHEVDVGEIVRADANELAICCRALGPLLKARRRPRARWRTKLVSDGNLRFYRTMLLGRAPGFAPGPPVIGPWRPIRLERRRGLVLERLRLRPRVEHGSGVLSVEADLRRLGGGEGLSGVSVQLSAGEGTRDAQLALTATAGPSLVVSGEVAVPGAARWWPHTHGAPRLYEARLIVGDVSFDVGRVGFRTLSAGDDLDRDGIQMTVNDVPVFARGAVWTPLDLRRPDATETELLEVLEAVVEGGMNMLRVPGVACYESERFYELCDELGILVWQDFMFANLDYPESDPDFMALVEREARALVERVGGRAGLAVLCGGSEVAQQIAMLGLDPALARGPLYGELLPSIVAGAGLDAAYVPSTPWGGDLPFRPNRGIANYYGVGAYLRPLEDARRSEVRFAAECLAFANVPDDAALKAFDAPGGLFVHDPRWKAGVPRDAGAGWDFDDVRDHYLRLLFGVDPVSLRSLDPDRYLELSRAVSGEVMAEVFGEWRRPLSPCGGALVLWLTDLVPGAGWGVLDHQREPKVAYHHLRRALAPVAVWSTDEGLGGYDIHVANDGNEQLTANLRVALYRDLELRMDERVTALELAPHGSLHDNLERLLGRFVDATWAYRFGPPAQDLIVFSLEESGDLGAKLISQTFRLPAGRSMTRESAERLGVSARLRRSGGGRAIVSVRSQRFLYGARIDVPGFRAADDAFSIEPGHGREVELVARDGAAEAQRGGLTALNLEGRAPIEVDTP